MNIAQRIRLLPLLSIALLAGAAACTSQTFTGKVVSCVDQKPIPGAGLKFKAVSATNATMAGEMPPQTKDDGTYQADVSLAKDTPVMLTIDKDGYESKQETLAAGAPQTICIAPKK